MLTPPSGSLMEWPFTVDTHLGLPLGQEHLSMGLPRIHNLDGNVQRGRSPAEACPGAGRNTLIEYELLVFVVRRRGSQTTSCVFRSSSMIREPGGGANLEVTPGVGTRSPEYVGVDDGITILVGDVEGSRHLTPLSRSSPTA